MAAKDRNAIGYVIPWLQPTAFTAIILALYAQVANVQDASAAAAVEAAAAIAELRLEIAKVTHYNVDMHDYIRSSEDPEWLKTVDETDPEAPIFTMAILSRAYEETFGITLRAYQGKSDFQVWREPQVAMNFYKSDLEVYRTRERHCQTIQIPKRAYQPISKNNPLHAFRECKRPVKYFGKLAIAGRARDMGEVQDGVNN